MLALFLYIYFRIANSKIVLIILFFVCLFIIFPIFIRGEFYFNKENPKLYYKIKLFNFILILKGYVQLIDEGAVIHLTKNKAILIPYTKAFELRKKVEPLKDYHLTRINLNLELGNNDNLILPCFGAFSFNYITNYINWFLYHKKPYFRLKTNVNVYTEESVFRIYFDGSVVFNLLMIILSLIKILAGKLYYAFAK